MLDFSDHRNQIMAYDLGHIEEHSPGLIHWHANGVKVLRKLEDFVLGLHQQYDYQEVRSPALLSKSLWEKSGHWDKYQDLMFVAQMDENEAYAIKPMSCPGHIGIYQQKRRSYRELPFALFEFGHVHRYESSGSLSGWMRLRGFVQDDSHVLCAPDQIDHVISQFVEMVQKAYLAFGFEKWNWQISLRPEKRAGDDALWDQAENALRQACQRLGIDAKEVEGEGAFYGPKLEASLVDRLGRSWQCGVAQVDFVLPGRFDLSYQNAEGKSAEPVMIHHAVLGSLERWLSIVMEHHQKLPQWLSPHAVAILPISIKQEEEALHLAKQLRRKGIEASVFSEGPLGGRVRDAKDHLYAHIAVLGNQEIEKQSISVRKEDGSSEVLLQSEWIDQLVEQLRSPASQR